MNSSEEIALIVIGCLLVAAICFGFGRWLGAVGFGIVVALVVTIGAGLLASSMLKTGLYSGLAEIFILMFVWAPSSAAAIIGSAAGWYLKARRAR